ncbi:MAG TPA: phenylalanine--tRNA ligase subunit beta [Candidatus Paceibacterota bacterium]|nr:phenylalanine--tRNA ligase subunit beta [Candidatus Paceibacterota bacterium]
MLVSWNWIKDYLGDTTLTAADAANLLGMHAFELEGIEETDGDTVIDVDILPNRSSDCLCQRGIARELASITGTPLAHDPLATQPELPSCTDILVDIADTNACPRFSASLMRGIAVGESPQWLKDRLEAIGQRPINNIVDATNYVMFAIGQPIHAYDAALFPQVDGAWRFAVRFARAEEQVKLLPEAGKDEERVVTCQGTELLIVDQSSDTPIGLAGVKGGSFAGVHDGTTDIIIETAHFHPTVTRKTARRLGIVIDASKRFENEPSRELIPYTQAEVTKLIADIAGGTLEGVVDVYPEHVEPVTTTIDPVRVNALLGLSLAVTDMVTLLERLGATVHRDTDKLEVISPWERTDLAIEEDYIEEIGRLHGYQHVQAVAPTPRSLPEMEMNARQYYSEVMRHTLLAAGFSEVITSSFRKKDEVQLKNALASDKRYLRSNLTKNITETLDTNASFADLLGTNDTRVFEIGTVFHKTETGIGEHVSLALGVRVKPSGYSGKEDAGVDQTIEVMNEALGTNLPTPINAHASGTTKTGVAFRYEKGVLEIDFTHLIKTLPQPEAYLPVTVGEAIQYQPFSTYPYVTRDIAMWVGESTPANEVETLLNEHAGPLRVRTTQFDEFTKDGRTSLGFRLVFQSKEKTLTDSEVNAVMETIYTAVSERGWEVR